MVDLKSQIKKIFSEKLDRLSLDSNNITTDILELKLNTITENILNRVALKETSSITIQSTSNQNINIDSFSIESGKYSDVNIKDNYKQPNKPTQNLTQGYIHISRLIYSLHLLFF